MATPVGHSFLAIALIGIGRPGMRSFDWRYLALAIVGTNAADLDFVPGIFVSDINRFHQGPSHSIFAAIIFSLIASAFARRLGLVPIAAGFLSFFSYASHMLLDLFTHDARPPFGIPILWPISPKSFASSWDIFSGVQHGVPGDSVGVFLSHLFSFSNALTVALEVAILLPLVMFSWVGGVWLAKRKRNMDTTLARPQ